MNNAFIDDQKSKYLKGFLQYGDTPKGTYWADKNSQYLRFERLIRNFDFSTKPSIHDIGCGTAELHTYLNSLNIQHEYLGSEIIPEMLEAARKKYPGIAVQERDVLSTNNIDICDICIISGLFNLAGDLNQQMWKEYAFSMLKKAFELSNKGVAANFLTSHRTFSDPTLSYFDPAEIMNYCTKKLSRYVIIDHGYPLYEFTVTILKSITVKESYPQEGFVKYFKNDK